MADKQYVPSKRVHSVLKRLLWPYFSHHGWKKRPGSSCAFVRPSSSGYWCLWVQVSQWGGILGGNSFTLNLVEQPKIDTSLANAPHDRILVDLLGPDDKAEGRALAVQIQSQIPDPPPDHKVYEWKNLPGKQGEHWVEYLANMRELHPDLWMPGIDVWLNYYSEEDLEKWVQFLLPRFDSLLGRCNAGAQQGVQADVPASGRPAA